MNKTMVLAACTVLILFPFSSPLCGQATKGTRAAAIQVLRDGGTLHDAALAAGGYYKGNEAVLRDWVSHRDLKSLGRDSSVVIIGTALRNVCQLTRDGRKVQTVYTVRVEESLKGLFREGDLVTVVLPGGMYGWPDGTTVKMSTPQFPKMVNGFRYALYLGGSKRAAGRLEAGEEERFFPVGNSEGVFQLANDGTVVAFADSPPLDEHNVSKFKWKSHQEFVDDARRSVRDDQ